MKKEAIISLAQTTFAEEANALLKIGDELDSAFYEVANHLYKSRHKIIVSGIGKSAHIANKIVATLNSTGSKSQFLHAAEAIHGDLGMVNDGDTIIILSKSGNTPEIKNLVTILKARKVTLVALTSHKESFLAKQSNYLLWVSIDKEACPLNLAPTTSTTAQLVMGDALAVVLMKMRDFSDQDFAQSHPGGSLGKRLYWRVEDMVDKAHRPLVQHNDPISEAIVAISKSRNGITAVFDNEKLVGVITDGDLRRMLYNKMDYNTLIASDLMSKSPKKITKDALATQALEMIELNKVGQLLVVDENETYIGILDFQDLLREGIV